MRLNCNNYNCCYKFVQLLIFTFYIIIFTYINIFDYQLIKTASKSGFSTNF